MILYKHYRCYWSSTLPKIQKVYKNKSVLATVDSQGSKTSTKLLSRCENIISFYCLAYVCWVYPRLIHAKGAVDGQ